MPSSKQTSAKRTALSERDANTASKRPARKAAFAGKSCEATCPGPVDNADPIVDFDPAGQADYDDEDEELVVAVSANKK